LTTGCNITKRKSKLQGDNIVQNAYLGKERFGAPPAASGKVLSKKSRRGPGKVSESRHRQKMQEFQQGTGGEASFVGDVFRPQKKEVVGEGGVWFRDKEAFPVDLRGPSPQGTSPCIWIVNRREHFDVGEGGERAEGLALIKRKLPLGLTSRSFVQQQQIAGHPTLGGGKETQASR